MASLADALKAARAKVTQAQQTVNNTPAGLAKSAQDKLTNGGTLTDAERSAYLAQSGTSQRQLEEAASAYATLTPEQYNKNVANDNAKRNDPLYGLTDAEKAQYQANAATASRFGSDFSWLDPAFQQQAQLMGPSATAQIQGDPLATANQYGALGQASKLANTPLNFQGSGQQQQLMDQWANVQQGAGAPGFTTGGQQQTILNSLMGVQSPDFTGSADQQTRAMEGLYGISDPTFGNDADQRAAFEKAMGMSSNTGAGALTFDDGSRQQEQYQNLRDIIAGGGADKIEMAARQKQRGEEESWLRGQREADMQDYAERGLTGSGQELLALSADRQASAGRNSLADLQTASDLEKRKLDAINSAGGLATDMRGNTIAEQSLLNQAKTTGLGYAADLATAMRNSKYQEAMGLNSAQQQKYGQIADLASNMRSQGYNEQIGKNSADLQKFTAAGNQASDIRTQDNATKEYLDKRMLDALQQQTDLSGKMRDQTMNEQTQGQQAMLNANQQWSNQAGTLRDTSFNEAKTRANAADDFSKYNADSINTANTNNSAFLQSAYTKMMQQQQERWKTMLDAGIDVSKGLLDTDQRDNIAGFGQANLLGTNDANTFNGAKDNYNAGTMGVYNTNANLTGNTNRDANTILPQAGQWAGQAFQQFMEAGAQGAGGGAMGGAGGGGLSKAGTTWASSVPSGTGGSSNTGGLSFDDWYKKYQG